MAGNQAVIPNLKIEHRFRGQPLNKNKNNNSQLDHFLHIKWTKEGRMSAEELPLTISVSMIHILDTVIWQI